MQSTQLPRLSEGVQGAFNANVCSSVLCTRLAHRACRAFSRLSLVPVLAGLLVVMSISPVACAWQPPQAMMNRAWHHGCSIMFHSLPGLSSPFLHSWFYVDVGCASCRKKSAASFSAEASPGTEGALEEPSWPWSYRSGLMMRACWGLEAAADARDAFFLVWGR